MIKSFESKANLFAQARALIANGADIPEAEISEDARFKEDLGIDSLSALEIIIDVEQRFGVEFADCEQKLVSSLRSVVDLIWEKMTVMQAA